MVLDKITNDSYYDIARKLGFDTGFELTTFLVGNPNWIEENGAYLSQILTEDEFRALWQQDQSLDEKIFDPLGQYYGGGLAGVATVIAGQKIGTIREMLSFLMTTLGGGATDIVEKIMTGNASDISAGDLAILALETLPISVEALSGILKGAGVSDDALKGLTAGFKGDKFAKEINSMDDVMKVVEQARNYAKNMGISFDDALKTIASEDTLRKMADISNTAGKQQYASSFLRVADDIASIGGIPKDVSRLIREGVDSVYEARRIYETAEEIAYQTKRNIRNVLWEITGGNDKLLEDMAFILQQEEAGTGAYHYFGLVCEETMYAGRAGKFGTAGTAGTASTASTGGTPFASGFMSGGDDAAKAAGSAKAGAGVSAAIGEVQTFADAVRAGYFQTVDDAAKFLRDAGVPEKEVSSFVARVGRESGMLGDRLITAYNTTTSAYSGLLKDALGKLRMTPVVGKLFTGTALAGGVVGGLYMAHSAITQIPFAGFMSEEMEQTSMFAEFPVMDNPIKLAQVIAYVTLPTWERGEYYATTLAPRVTWLPSQYTWSETAQTMADYHNIPFTGKVAIEVQNLQEMGAWKGFEGTPEYDEEGMIIGWNITSWGEPTSAEERQEFLATPEGEKYIKNYEGEIQRLATEDPGKLYALYQQGVIGWYDMSEDMRNTITTYQQQLKNWQYQSLRNFDPQDVLDLGSTVASQVWYGQEDMGILEQAKQIGDWIYTLVQNGELSAREAEPVLQELSLRLRGNENAEGIWTVDENGNKSITWNTLSEDQLNEQFGSTEKLVEMPQLSFGDKPVTLSQTERDAVQYLENQGMIQKTQGTLSPEEVKMRFGPALGQRITGLEAEELERVFNEFAESAKGTKSMRGVGFTGQATAEEQAAMAAVPGSGFTWTPRENLTRAEEQALSQIENGIRSWDDVKNIAPETYNSLVQKGYGPGAKTPATQTPTQTPTQGVSDTDVENFFNAIMEEAQQSAGQYGVFETPTKVKGEPLYDPGTLAAMKQFGTPQERATAQKQQDIYNKQKYAGKDKGTYGYELASLSNDQRKMLEELATVLETGEIPEKSKLVRHEATQPGWGTTYGYGSIKK